VLQIAVQFVVRSLHVSTVICLWTVIIFFGSCNLTVYPDRGLYRL